MMRPLQNILTLELFTNLKEGKKVSSFSLPWWNDCINQVVSWLLSDKTTTPDNLREKARAYANNYIIMQPEDSCLDKERVVNDIADKVAKDLEDANFDNRPPASIAAQASRNSIPRSPEERFIKIRP